MPSVNYLGESFQIIEGRNSCAPPYAHADILSFIMGVQNERKQKKQNNIKDLP
jgi:hypothetical protein